jgi:predicted lipoprotein with Yx(FWY)xxD motif
MEPRRSDSLARPRPVPVFLAAAVLLGMLAALIVAGHGSAAGSTQIKVSKTKYGKILVNAQGRTLYMFAADKRGTSSCYGKCASYWPPLLTTSSHVTATGLTAAKLGTTKRKDGKLQVTYNGHPLYRFVQDSKAGQTSGQGLNISGGLWWVLSPAGTPTKHATAAGTGTGGGGGGGGYGG